MSNLYAVKGIQFAPTRAHPTKDAAWAEFEAWAQWSPDLDHARKADCARCAEVADAAAIHEIDLSSRGGPGWHWANAW